MGIEGIMVRSFAQFGVVQTDYDMTRLLTENALLRQPGGIQEAAPISPDILTPRRPGELRADSPAGPAGGTPSAGRTGADAPPGSRGTGPRRAGRRAAAGRATRAVAGTMGRRPHAAGSDPRHDAERCGAGGRRSGGHAVGPGWRHERWTDAGYGGRLAPAGRTCARRPSVPVRQPDGANHRPDSGTGGTDADCATNRGTRRRAGHRTGKRPDGGANGRRRCRAHGFAHPAPPDCLTRLAVPSAAVPLRERMPPFAAAGKGHRLSCVPHS